MAPVLTIAASLYCIALICLRIGLGFEFLRGDVLSYWNESLSLTPYSTWWMPGYPATIALLRKLTMGSIPPVALMVAIAGIFYLVAVGAVYTLARELRIGPAREVALLFAVYPLVGLTYSVYPVADSMAMALLMVCLLYYQRERWTACALFFGLMILTHKATWFFGVPLLVFAFVTHPRCRIPLLAATVPLSGLIAAGAVYHGDIFWFMRWSAENLLTSKSSLPVLDGILGSLLTRSAPKVAKGTVALAVFALAAAVIVLCYRRRFWIGVALGLGLVLMGVVLNQYEIWALVRFSKPVVIPAAYVFLGPDREPITRSRALFTALLVGSLISNLAYSYYMVEVFYP